jgi:class 3 adenylate cyclase
VAEYLMAIAARVMGEAGSGEVLISRAVRDLLSGSDIVPEDCGLHVLRTLTASAHCPL